MRASETAVHEELCESIPKDGEVYLLICLRYKWAAGYTRARPEVYERVRLRGMRLCKCKCQRECLGKRRRMLILRARTRKWRVAGGGCNDYGLFIDHVGDSEC